METEVLLFQIDDKRFGVPSGGVKEVVRAVKLSPLPQPSEVVEGLLNLRGTVLPVVDLRALFGLAIRSIRHTDHLVIVQTAFGLIAFRVDRAVDLIRLATDDLQTSDLILAKSEYVKSIGMVDDLMVHILDVPRVVASGDVTKLPAGGETTGVSP